jgi:hypothetical protein
VLPPRVPSARALRSSTGLPGHRRGLQVHPDGVDQGQGTHLSVSLDALDAFFEMRVEYKFTLVNQVDASKSLSYGQ